MKELLAHPLKVQELPSHLGVIVMSILTNIRGKAYKLKKKATKIDKSECKGCILEGFCDEEKEEFIPEIQEYLEEQKFIMGRR